METSRASQAAPSGVRKVPSYEIMGYYTQVLLDIDIA